MALAVNQSPEKETPVGRALDQLTEALVLMLAVLDDGALDHCDDAGLLGVMQRFERFQNRLSLVDHRIISDGERRGLPGVLAQPSMREVLVQLVGLSPAEAGRRVLAAQVCAERVSAQGEVLAPVRPRLAAGQAAGKLSAEQVHVVATALAKVDRPGIAPAEVEAGERLLCEFAATFGAKDLKQLAERTVDAIDPDGTLADEQLALDRRHLTLRRCRDGMYAGEFRLTGSAGAKLAALLHPLARPRTDTLPRADDSQRQEVDLRTYGQRSHDALEEVCDRVLRTGQVVGVGGTPATVIVTVTLDDLLSRLGYATTTDETLLSVPELLKVAHEAEVIPAVMSAAGAVLTLGRSRRIATAAQTHALVARDHGCSFPGCDRPPEWCERHHMIEWVNGGPTDLDNLTLLCRYHHHNFAQRGWTCQLNRDRLPEWRPPRWLDPQQRPLLNSRIQAQQIRGRQQVRPKLLAGQQEAASGGGLSVHRELVGTWAGG